MGLEDFRPETLNQSERRKRADRITDTAPAALVEAAREIDRAIIDELGCDTHSVSSSGDGITYNVAGLAICTLQPQRGQTGLVLHFDPSAKQSVTADPLSSGGFPHAEAIGETNWKRSFRLTLRVTAKSCTDEELQRAVRQSYQQVKQQQPRP